MTTHNPGTHEDRDDKSGSQQGQRGATHKPQEEQHKQGPGKGPSRGTSDNPGASDSERTRKPGQKPGQ